MRTGARDAPSQEALPPPPQALRSLRNRFGCVNGQGLNPLRPGLGPDGRACCRRPAGG